MRDTVLFDLDGTLVPMGMEEFTRAYFHQLARVFAPRGYDKKALIDAIWTGSKAMQNNDGTQTNRALFWDAFAAVMGEASRHDESAFDAFYGREFDLVQGMLGICANRRADIDRLKARGLTLGLATNPQFPLVAVATRLAWVNLRTDDFSVITTYDTARYCKPNPGYYTDILAALRKTPEQCLMIGNNPVEDGAARRLGIETFLVTDTLDGVMTEEDMRCPHGSFAEAMAFIEQMTGNSIAEADR